MSGPLAIGDWGGTRLRLWRIDHGLVAERREGPGILACGDPAEALVSAIGDWGAERITLCGMAGAREGLREAPYVRCPAGMPEWRDQSIDFALGGMQVTIAAGLSSPDDRGRPDVMRGEEAQIFGAMALDPTLATGTRRVLLPGTHSKWVGLRDGSIVEFRTFITGELFALLGNSTLYTAGVPSEADEREGFAAGLARAGQSPGLAADLFEARAAQMQDGKSSAWAGGFVSGLLIGDEVQHMVCADPVVVIGDPDLSARYGQALRHFGVPFECIDGEPCAIAGLRLLDDD